MNFYPTGNTKNNYKDKEDQLDNSNYKYKTDRYKLYKKYIN